MNNVDLYCERIGASFWAEPINALTNVSFILAAWGVWYLTRRTATITPSIWLLLICAVMIGIGSFLFHTIATSWARVLDVLPILVFQLLFLWLYLRRVVSLSWFTAAPLLVGYLAAVLFSRRFPEILNGSLPYAPAILAILALGLYHVIMSTRGRFDLLIAAGLFAVSLFFRIIDNEICPIFTYGTHFLWHILNGVVVFLAIRAFVRRSMA